MEPETEEHIYYLLDAPEVPDPERINQLRTIRAAIRVFEPTGSAVDAQHVLKHVREKGFAILGVSDENSADIFERLRRILAYGEGWAFGLDIDTEERKRRYKAKQLTAEGKSPEEVFAATDPRKPDTPPAPEERIAAPVPREVGATALALMASADGNPAQAASQAWILGQTTKQFTLYEAVMQFYVDTFPWIKPILKNSGMIT